VGRSRGRARKGVGSMYLLGRKRKSRKTSGTYEKLFERSALCAAATAAALSGDDRATECPLAPPHVHRAVLTSFTFNERSMNSIWDLKTISLLTI